MLPEFDLLLLFILILSRISGFLISAPFFSLANFPNRVKVLMGLGISALLVPVVDPLSAEPAGPASFFFIIGKELGIGLAMGVLCTIIFSSFAVGGQIIDIKIGFFASQTLDPMTGNQVTVMSRFLFYLGLAFLLAVNAHHELIRVLAGSFEILPPGQAAVSGEFALVFVRAFGDMMVMAVKIAAPIIAVTLAVDIGLGLVGRTAPQMNIFILGFPIKIITGLFTLSILLPVFGTVFNSIFNMMEEKMIMLLRGLS